MAEIKDIKDRAPNPDTVRHLEKLLKFAQSGELRSLVYVCGWDDDSQNYRWVVDPRNGARRMLGTLTLLQADYMQEVLLQDDESSIRKAKFRVN